MVYGLGALLSWQVPKSPKHQKPSTLDPYNLYSNPPAHQQQKAQQQTKQRTINLCIYIYICVCMIYIYIYIFCIYVYVEKEREREGGRERESVCVCVEKEREREGEGLKPCLKKRHRQNLNPRIRETLKIHKTLKIQSP